jgi:hypothetical protein
MRTISMSRSGRFVALRRPGGIELVDALGTSPRHALTDEPDDFACVGTMLWVLARGVIARYSFDGLRPLEPSIVVGDGAARLVASSGDNAATALVTGARNVLAHGLYDKVSVEEIAAPGVLFPLQGRRVLAVGDDLRVLEVGRGEIARMPRPESGEVLDAFSLFAGRALAVLVRGDQHPFFVVLRPTGGLVHKVAVAEPVRWAIAENRGVALLAIDDRRLVSVDLRYGRVTGEGEAPIPLADLAIDADGQFVAFAGEATSPPNGSVTRGAGRPERDGATPPVVHMPYTELVSGGLRRAAAIAAPSPEPEPEPEPEPDRAPSPSPSPLHVVAAPAPVPADAADAEPPPAEPAPAPPPIVIPDVLPRAFGEDLPPMQISPRPGIEPYASAREHIDELLDVVASRAARTIADAWNSGRLSIPSEDQRPFEREVLAILGRAGEYAQDLLADAEQRLSRLTQRSALRATATIAAGTPLPFVELAREMNLSSTAAQVLLVVVAPQVRGEVADRKSVV